MAKVSLKFKLNNGNEYTIDKSSGFGSVSSVVESTVNPDGISYEILSNSGSFDGVDVNNEISKLIQNGQLSSSNVPVDIYFNGEKVQGHITSDSSYTQDDELSVNMTNSIINFDNVNSNFVSENTIYPTLILKELLGFENVEDFSQLLDNEMLSYLSSIQIPFTILADMTQREAINKVCELCQISIFKDDNDQYKVINARPIHKNNQKYIVIPENHQYSKPAYNLFNKNVYDKVTVKPYKNSKEQKYVYDTDFTISNENGEVDIFGLGDENITFLLGSCCFMGVPAPNTDYWRGVNATKKVPIGEKYVVKREIVFDIVDDDFYFYMARNDGADTAKIDMGQTNDDWVYLKVTHYSERAVYTSLRLDNTGWYGSIIYGDNVKPSDNPSTIHLYYADYDSGTQDFKGAYVNFFDSSISGNNTYDNYDLYAGKNTSQYPLVVEYTYNDGSEPQIYNSNRVYSVDKTKSEFDLSSIKNEIRRLKTSSKTVNDFAISLPIFQEVQESGPIVIGGTAKRINSINVKILANESALKDDKPISMGDGKNEIIISENPLIQTGTTTFSDKYWHKSNKFYSINGIQKDRILEMNFSNTMSSSEIVGTVSDTINVSNVILGRLKFDDAYRYNYISYSTNRLEIRPNHTGDYEFLLTISVQRDGAVIYNNSTRVSKSLNEGYWKIIDIDLNSNNARGMYQIQNGDEVVQLLSIVSPMGYNDYKLEFRNTTRCGIDYQAKDIPMAYAIAKNILNDYKNGIKALSLQVSATDYYDADGNLAIDDEQGQLLQVGQIVRIDKDNDNTPLLEYADGSPYLWKIVGREFSDSGAAMLNLTLQEAKSS